MRNTTDDLSSLMASKEIESSLRPHMYGDLVHSAGNLESFLSSVSQLP